MADANETVFQNQGINIDGSLKFDAESQTKLDNQAGILRSIQLETTSQSDCHPSPYEPTADFHAEISKRQPTTLTTSLSILMVVLAGSNAALAYKLATQRDNVPQLLVLHLTKTHNITARPQECSERNTSLRPALKTSHQSWGTRSCAKQTCLAKHSLGPSKEEGSWQALWRSTNDSKGALGSLENDPNYRDVSFMFGSILSHPTMKRSRFDMEHRTTGLHPIS